MGRWLLLAVILLALIPTPANADIVWISGTECQSPAPSGARFTQLPIRYRVGAGIDKTIVRQAFDMWENRTLKFIEDAAASNSIELETAPPGTYSEVIVAGNYGQNIHRIVGFNIWLDIQQIQNAGGHWGALLVAQIAKATGISFSGCSNTLPAAWPTISAGDTWQRDLLYPPFQLYLPLLEK